MCRFFEVVHVSTHAGMKCPEPCCPFFSTNKEDLLDHVNVTHLKFPGFRCPQCSAENWPMWTRQRRAKSPA